MVLLLSKATVGRLRRVLYEVECYLLSQSFQVPDVGGGGFSSGSAFLIWSSKESRLL